MTPREALKRLQNLIELDCGASEVASKFLQAYKTGAEFELGLLFKLDNDNFSAVITLLGIIKKGDEYFEICDLI